MTKKKVFWISLIGTAIAYVLTNPVTFGLCQKTYYFGDSIRCSDTLLPMIGQVLGLFALGLLLFSIVTYFLREEVFRAWLKFAYVWIPVSMVLIYLAGGSSGGGFGIPNVLDQEFVSLILASLFVLLSLVIIIVKSILLRGK